MVAHDDNPLKLSAPLTDAVGRKRSRPDEASHRLKQCPKGGGREGAPHKLYAALVRAGVADYRGLNRASNGHLGLHARAPRSTRDEYRLRLGKSVVRASKRLHDLGLLEAQPRARGYSKQRTGWANARAKELARGGFVALVGRLPVCRSALICHLLLALRSGTPELGVLAFLDNTPSVSL